MFSNPRSREMSSFWEPWTTFLAHPFELGFEMRVVAPPLARLVVELRIEDLCLFFGLGLV